MSHRADCLKFDLKSFLYQMALYAPLATTQLLELLNKRCIAVSTGLMQRTYSNTTARKAEQSE